MEPETDPALREELSPSAARINCGVIAGSFTRVCDSHKRERSRGLRNRGCVAYRRLSRECEPGHSENSRPRRSRYGSPLSPVLKWNEPLSIPELLIEFRVREADNQNIVPGQAGHA